MTMQRMMMGAIASLMVLLTFSNAQALLVSSSVSPPTRTVAANTPAVLPVTWRVLRSGALGPVTVSSYQIVFRLTDANGPIVYTLNKTISKTQNVTSSPEFYTFSEAVPVPREAVFAATKAGTNLDILRTFTDLSDTTFNTAELGAYVTGGGSGNLSITRLELTFNDGSMSCNAKPGKELTAIANIQANGSGLLRGAWQVREGGGMGSFRTLRTIQAAITSGHNTVIQSPPLPIENAGDLMEVRLVVESPTLGFTVPTLTCGIGAKDTRLKHLQDTGKLAKVTEPAPNSLLNEKTSIKWEAVKGAKSYRVEILAKADGEPLTAQMVKPGQTSAKLSPLTLDKLDATGRYTVRVVAQ